METGIVIEVAKAVPALLVLAWVVNRFLNSLKERDDGIRAVFSEAAGVQKETNQMLGRVGEALDQQSEDSARTRKVLHETQEIIVRWKDVA